VGHGERHNCATPKSYLSIGKPLKVRANIVVIQDCALAASMRSR
jgi:hypothetical protein